MSDFPLLTETWSPLEEISVISVTLNLPQEYRTALVKAWPDVVVLDVLSKASGNGKYDLQIVTQKDQTQTEPDPNSTRLFFGSFKKEELRNADALVADGCCLADFLNQVSFLDGILHRKRYREKTRRGVLSKLVKLQTRFDDLDRDLSKARQLQKRLINQSWHEWESGSLNFRIWPKGAIGGDLMGWFEAGQNHIGFFSIDVVGHGIASSLFCARIAGLFTGNGPTTNMALTTHGNKTCPRDPSKVIGELNQLMFDHFDSDYYLTATLGFVDKRMNGLAFCQAGHTRPIRFGSQLPTQEIEVEGLPVGLVPGAEYETTFLNSLAGSRICLYSDGVSECQNPSSEIQYGEERLLEFLSTAKNISADNVLSNLYVDAAAFGDLHDDACAMVLTFT